MKLESLTLENFKSYKGTQVIGPFSALTAIIGPNGSGKSNLMDALSFVLGIKSSNLRCSSMQELVHNGQSSASVTAVFTKNGEKFLFSRRIVRNASEFRINEQQLTWQEYNARLQEENILTRAKNFLVFQGDVESIAAQSPKDLTRLIETISGSYELKEEYERLKEQTEKATENSSVNFNKKKSVTAELKLLKEQKEDATKFRGFTSKKDQLTIYHALYQLCHLEKEFDKLKSEIEDNDLKEFEEAKIKLEGDMSQMKKIQAKNLKQIMRLESLINSAIKEKLDKRPLLLQVEEKSRHAHKKVLGIKENASQEQENLDDTKKKVEDLKKTLKNLQYQHDEFNRLMAQKSLEFQALEGKDLEQYQKLKKIAMQESINEREVINAIERNMSLTKERERDLTERIGHIDAKVLVLSRDSKSVELNKKRLINEIDSVAKELQEEKLKNSTLASEKKRLRLTESELLEKLNDANNRLFQARVDKTSSERGAKFQQTLSSLKRIYPGITLTSSLGVYGRIIDLCKPVNRKYETAISVILGRNMDAIVVADQKTAIECIRYMKDQRAGQATFLPLDSITVKPVNEKYRTFSKGAQLAIDLLESDGLVDVALQFACGSSLVCDTLEVAKYVCYEKKQEVKGMILVSSLEAVTLDGTVIHKTGMITGGRSSHSNAARRWEQKDVENIQKARESLQSQIEEVTKKLRKLGQSDQAAFNISGLESRLRSLETELTTSESKLDSINLEISEYRREKEELDLSYQKVELDIESKNNEIGELDSTIRQLENRIFSSFCKKMSIADIRAYEQNQLSMSDEKKEHQLKYSTDKAKLNNLITFETDALGDSLARLTQLNASLSKESMTIETLNRQKEEFERIQEKIDINIQKNKQELLAIQQENEGVQGRLSVLKNELENHNTTFENVSKVFSNKESEIERIQAEKIAILRRCKMEEIKVPFSNGVFLNDVSFDELEKNDMVVDQDELKIDFCILKDESKECFSPVYEAQLREDIRALSVEIERLAPNSKMLDKYGQVQSKLKMTNEEFENSRQEAKYAKDSFQAVKKERYKCFFKAYSHISEQIDKIYKELTRSKTFPLGGTAYLSLEDSEEPYLDGVKYHAMPPMKRFREMEMLSGGEKTVAALALLFAIHSYRPAPFFILDEVDAALDNTNVSKVARYIKKHASDDFQFIVISLKNTFYESAQGLVGVYKDNQEFSSRVLTLDLTKFEE